METVGIVLNIANEHVEAFERGFRAQELPIWADLHARGLLVTAALSRIEGISTAPVTGATQFLITVIFATDEGHHVHDNDPRFQAWNKEADTYQLKGPYVFGGEAVVSVGP